MKRLLTILFTFALILSLTACGTSPEHNTIGGSNQKEEEKKEEETTETNESGDTPINQEITFGDYIVKADSFSVNTDEEQPVITINLTVVNNSANMMTIDNIIGVTAYQGDTVLSDARNLYHGPNAIRYEHTVDSGQSNTIDIKYQLDNLDTPVEFSVFNDGSLGLSDQGLGADLDLNINPADKTFTANIINEPNHG